MASGLDHERRLPIPDRFRPRPSGSQAGYQSSSRPVEEDRGETNGLEDGSHRLKRRRVDDTNPAETRSYHDDPPPTCAPWNEPSEFETLAMTAPAPTSASAGSRTTSAGYPNRHRSSSTDRRTYLTPTGPSRAQQARKITEEPRPATSSHDQNATRPVKPRTALAKKKCPICLEKTDVSTATICGTYIPLLLLKSQVSQKI